MESFGPCEINKGIVEQNLSNYTIAEQKIYRSGHTLKNSADTAGKTTPTNVDYERFHIFFYLHNTELEIRTGKSKRAMVLNWEKEHLLYCTCKGELGCLFCSAEGVGRRACISISYVNSRGRGTDYTYALENPFQQVQQTLQRGGLNGDVAVSQAGL